jgi:hypothetical protein
MTIDRMTDRCRRICGPNDKHCFINHKEQINCIADMVVNKAAAASMLIDLSLDGKDPSALKDNLKDSVRTINELSNWIQYLQLVQNLQKLSSLVLDSDLSEKREEIRYPVPAGHERKVMLRGTCGEDAFNAQLLNFSQSGMGFHTPQILPAGTDAEVTISGPDKENPVKFSGELRYSVKTNGHHLNGMLIKEVQGNNGFNFFSHVFRILCGT